MAVVQVTQTLRIKVNRECPENPVYLCWRNKKNGVGYWLFSRKQTEILNSESGGEFEHYNANLATAPSRTDFISKENQDSMILGAENLLINDILGLKGLLESPKVEMLISQNPVTWKTVQVVPGTFNIRETDETRSRIELEIMFPKQYSQTL